MKKLVKNKKKTIFEKIFKSRDPLVEGVRWTENYADVFEKSWKLIPSFVRTLILTTAIFLFGSTLRGDWLIILVHFLKHIGSDFLNIVPLNDTTSSNNGTSTGITFESLGLQNWQYFICMGAVGSFTIYFLIGGFIHWHFYVRQRNNTHEWKIQPDKFLSPVLEMHEILVGSFSLLLCSILTGTVACYASNGGSLLTIYYKIEDFGWLWFFLQYPVIFIYQDYITYLMHRLYHTPWLYKNFHKLHHTYKQPTAFSVTAIHPVEIIHMQITLMLPLVVFPVHWFPFYTIALYTYYHGIIDHSGVNFKAFWWQPWQPDAVFHDNHHQYFHVNFGFNIFIWDKLHGTYRRKDRVYTEEIFYGKGKELHDVPKEVLMNDIAERNSENPLAYRNNTNINIIDSPKDEQINLKSRNKSKKSVKT